MRQRYSMARPFVVLVVSLLVYANVSGQGFPFGPKKPKRPDTVLIIHAGILLADPNAEPLRRHTVIVRNAKVAEVRAGFVAQDAIDAEGAQLEFLDLSDHFVMPGMFDSHVHLSRATGTYQQGLPTINQQIPVAEATVNTLINARLNLAAGFTAVRDLGSDPESVFAVRDAINAGALIGPTILASGPSISVTAGHGDDASSSYPDERARAGVCDGADECRMLVRHSEKTGADLIKFKATGGFSSNTGLLPHMSAAEMEAIVTAAHMRDIKVTSHAYDPAAIAAALDADVDSIEHGYLVSDDNLRVMKKQGVFLVPTLVVAEPPSMVRRFMGKGEPSSVRIRREAQAFERAYAQGIKIAFGTDAGIYPHGSNADELVRMAELGMAQSDVIRSATVVAAELFGVDGLTGSIEVDADADIIAIRGNPIDDIALLGDVDYVIKAGQVAKRAGLMQLPLDYSLPQKY